MFEVCHLLLNMEVNQNDKFDQNKDELNDFQKWKQKKKVKRKLVNVDVQCTKKTKSSFSSKQVEIADLKSTCSEVKNLQRFDEYPLSENTKQGLHCSGYIHTTSIQKASLTPALQGKDILGAAKTGSGKTLAFIIPILESLYQHCWGRIDGTGALVISPTRELAYQIFDVLQKVGREHCFSAGLVIGGKNVEEEASRIQSTNIVVCTPGRLLQHLNSTSYFHLDNLKLLVLDEADQILDMGFSSTINAIIESLPKQRQTLLYSATQTQSVKDLARLSLQNPVYISVHADSLHSTPVGLKQRFLVCELHDKLDILFSFVRNNLKSKTLAFLSSCKEVQYYFSIFCRLRPGISVMHLHGRMNQQRRLTVYQEFSRKKFALLFSTDLAARGLDFPNIDWVVQVDCPEDSCSYIHRVGRTARFHDSGNALLMLLPSEKNGMLLEFTKMKVPIVQTTINRLKTGQLQKKLQSFCAEDIDLKNKAQRCFKAYVRSVHLMKNKDIFSVPCLPLEAFALSLGLPCAPKIRYLQQRMKNSKAVDDTEEESWLQSNDTSELFTIKPDAYKDEILSTVCDDTSQTSGKVGKRHKTKAADAKHLIRKGKKLNQKIQFNENNEVHEGDSLDTISQIDKRLDMYPGGIDIDKAKVDMIKRDEKDRLQQKKQIQKQHQQARKLSKEIRRKIQSEKKKEDVALVDAYSNGGYSDDHVDGVSSDQMGSSSQKLEQQNLLNSDDKMGFSIADEENLALHFLNPKT